FFQAEDGIRDGHVTGVQTCALPIYQRVAVGVDRERAIRGDLNLSRAQDGHLGLADMRSLEELWQEAQEPQLARLAAEHDVEQAEIGRASCRERVWMPVVRGGVQNER